MAIILENELSALEEQPNSTVTRVLDFRQRQIGVILNAVNDVAKRHNLSTRSVNEVTNRLAELQDRAIEISKG